MESVYSGVVYEWDDEKNMINHSKHGIFFSDAIRVFDDPNRIVDYDRDHSDEENRWKVTGMVDNIIVVIYTDRLDRTRIISARRANKHERRDYYGNR